MLFCSDAINAENERENARVVAEATSRRQPQPPPASQSSSSQASTSTAAPAAGTKKTSRLLGLFGCRGR